LILHITLFIAENGENSGTMKAQLDSLDIYERVAYNFSSSLSLCPLLMYSVTRNTKDFRM